MLGQNAYMPSTGGSAWPARLRSRCRAPLAPSPLGGQVKTRMNRVFRSIVAEKTSPFGKSAPSRRPLQCSFVTTGRYHNYTARCQRSCAPSIHLREDAGGSLGVCFLCSFNGRRVMTRPDWGSTRPRGYHGRGRCAIMPAVGQASTLSSRRWGSGRRRQAEPPDRSFSLCSVPGGRFVSPRERRPVRFIPAYIHLPSPHPLWDLSSSTTVPAHLLKLSNIFYPLFPLIFAISCLLAHK